MTAAFRAELAGITRLVQAATITDETRHSAAWCIDQLPNLYGRHCQTHESRYGDEILRLERAVLGKLAEAPSGPEVQAVVEAVEGRFRLLTEQFGLPGLAVKAPRSPRPRSKKAS